MGTHKQIKETQMTRMAFQLMEDVQLFCASFRTSLRMSADNSTENGDGRKEGWSSGIGKVQGRKGERGREGKGKEKGEE